MDAISSSFFYENSLAISFAIALLAAASSFALIKLVALIAYVSKSIATRIHAFSLDSVRPVGRIAVSQ